MVSQAIVPRPALLRRLDSAARVTVVSAPAGSGKTLALQSWMSAPGRAECTARLPVQREERDEQRFWLQVASALRRTGAGAALVRRVTNLSMPEIAGELYVSHNTIRAHMRHLYAKLGAHRRSEAVERARALGLLAPAPRAS